VGTLSSNPDDNRLMEKQVKQAILDHPLLFKTNGIDHGPQRVVFEKMAYLRAYGNLIADALIFTENAGIIGVEIKTEYDTIKRLHKQLQEYIRVCNYVYVFIHDSKIDEVRKLMEHDSLLGYVGIISYTDYNGTLIAGVLQEAQPSPYFDLHYGLNMLWKPEVQQLVSAFSGHQTDLMANTYEGLEAQHVHKGAGVSDITAHNPYASKNHSKKTLMEHYINAYGVRYGTKVLCQTFIHEDFEPEKDIRLWDFGVKIP